MKNEIIQKLGVVLSKSIESEEQVVYILVQMRKLIDHSQNKSKYLVLIFYCDWALHIKLDRTTACQMLEKFDEALGAQNDDKTYRVAVEMLGPIISFETFRDEFINFLLEQSLPTQIAGKMQPWGRFLQLYLRVVTDCPLAYSRKLPLQHIDELKLTRYDNPYEQVPEGAIFAFGISWSFHKSGNEMAKWNNDVFYPRNPKPGAFYDFSVGKKTVL